MYSNSFQSAITHNTSRTTRAFTLIELSIVLVIIGLIVGGVLVGRTLIKSAEIRNAASYLQSISAAINTYRVKYDCIAGDCTNATSFLPANYPTITGYNGCAGNGNGNGNIDVWHCESSQALQSLRIINLMPVFSQSSANTYASLGTIYTLGINNSVGYFYYQDLYGSNANLNSNTFTWADYSLSTWVSSYALTPNQAQQIDLKMDDGKPSIGLFMGKDASTPTSGTIVTNSCVSVSDTYISSDAMGCRSIYVLK